MKLFIPLPKILFSHSAVSSAFDYLGGFKGLSRLFTLAKGLNMDLIDFHRRPSLSFTLQVLLAKVRAVSIMKIFFQNLTSPYPYCTSFKVLIKML